jgi:hypothetical protein
VVEDLDLSLNAGSASILVGGGTLVSGTLGVNAGSIELCTDGKVAIRLTVESNITFSHNLDETDLRRNGDTWSLTPSLPSGTVDLQVEGNAASFTLNPDGG